MINFGRHFDPEATGDLVKIVFPLEENAWHGYATETMWAKKCNVDKYLLLNTPFYLLGISYRDSVRANEAQGMLRFVSVAERGGHSTYRFFLAEDLNADSFTKFWAPLERLGCTYEAATRRFFAVDVPPEADIYLAYGLLEKGQSCGAWHFEEGHCGHLMRDN